MANLQLNNNSPNNNTVINMTSINSQEENNPNIHVQSIPVEVRGNSSAPNDLFGGRAPSTRVINIERNMALEQNLYNDDTLLIDIEPSHYGIFCCVSPSITFIPDRYVRKVRKIYSKHIQACIDDVSEIYWKKLMLLPLVLFDNSYHSSLIERKKNLLKRLTMLEADDWSTFTWGSLSKKKSNDNPLTQEEIHKAVMRLAQQGEISKALRKLKADPRKVPTTFETLEKLKSKFPNTGVSSLNNNQLAALKSYVPEDDPEYEPIFAYTSEIERILFKAKSLVAHGSDHLRYEHLRQLWSASPEDPNKGEFRKALTTFINLIIHAEIPPAFADCFKDIEVIALPKGDEDLRPIGLQNIFRKIASAICNNRSKDFNVKHFENLQYCMSPFGAEMISHSFKAVTELSQTWDIWSKDGINGFGNMFRVCGLHETKIHFSSIFPILRLMYGTSSTGLHGSTV